jgi:nitrite reductase/ring-hydroxylating ferredoxin subunit
MSDGTPPVPPTGIPRASPAGADAALVPLERPDGRTQWTFEHAGRCYAVFAVGDELHVTDGACPHHGGPLAEGLVRDGVVTCPWHWYSYELATGRCRTAAGYQLRRYPVVLAGGRPHAALPAAAQAPSWSQILRAHAQQATRATGAGPDLRFPPGPYWRS